MAQVDYFLKIDGIDGESTDAKHKGEIDLQSWGFGASQSGTMHSGGGGGGRCEARTRRPARCAGGRVTWN